MSTNLVDLMFLVFFSGVLATIAGVGILALPWKDEELDDTANALRDAWAWLDGALQRTARQVGQAAAPAVHAVRAEAYDRPTTAFDGPTAPHIA